MKRPLLISILGLALATLLPAAQPVTCKDGRLDNGIVSVSFADDGTHVSERSRISDTAEVGVQRPVGASFFAG